MASMTVDPVRTTEPCHSTHAYTRERAGNSKPGPFCA